MAKRENVRDRKKFLKKSYRSLGTYLKQWYEGNVKEGAVCLAIARKAPRLMEWYEKKKGIVRSSTIITENAIPFVDWSKVESCIETDEAIYNGTTFATVYSAVSSVVDGGASRVQCNPLVVTEDAMQYASIKSIVPSSALRIESANIPFFIDTITSRFLELGKPYDVEYPIIYIDLGKSISQTDLMTIARELAEKEGLEEWQQGGADVAIYGTETYSRERKKRFSNVTFLADYLFEEESDREYSSAPDFCKLRFYADGSRLCVVPMSPYTINFRDIRKDSPLFEGELLDVWNQIYACAKVVESASEEYKMQWKKSLVTMANYLLSFNTFLLLRDSLMEVVRERGADGFRLYVMDLCYLLGKDLAAEVCGMLHFDMDYSDPKRTPLPFSTLPGYVPEAYKEGYYAQIGADIRGGLTDICDMVSGQFSSMHWQVELKSRKAMGTKSDRLHFGESYASMEERYRLLVDDSKSQMGEANLRSEISKNIDSRIDRGSVVPGYFMRATPSMEYWTRMFRSGENEDLFRDQTIRIMSHIYVNYCKATEENFIRRQELLIILTLLSKRDEAEGSTFFGYAIKTVKRENAYHVMSQYADSLWYMIDQMKAVGLLEEDRMGFVTAAPTMMERYGDGTPLSTNAEEQLDVTLRDVAAYAKRIDHDAAELSNLMNSLMYDQGEIAKGIERLRGELRSLITQEQPSLNPKDTVEEYTDSFASVIDFMPNVSVSKTADAADSDRENELEEIVESACRSVRDTGMRVEFERIFIIFTLWVWYKYGEKSNRLNEKALPHIHRVFRGEGRKFSDGVSQEEWFKDAGSFSNIKNQSESSVSSHLLEALEA